MQLPLSSVNKPKIGTCPHGLLPGACPVCSGMGGGAKREVKSNSDEMTWDECFAIGQMLKAQKFAQQTKRHAMENQLNTPLNFGAKLANISEKIALFSQKLINFVSETKSLPKIISKPVVFVLSKLVIPVLNLIGALPALVNKAVNFVKERLTDISDKLSAIFGELKNSAEKKISDALKNFKKRIKSLFDLPDLSRADDEDRKFDGEKKIFEFKKYLNRKVMLNLFDKEKR